jgi:CheY-like chemotaxis protein
MNGASTAQAVPDASRRVLIVEDEVLIAMVLEDMLDMLGHAVVGTPSTYAEAEAAINEPVFPLADRLQAVGTAFVFATGSRRDSLPGRFATTPVIEKPYAVAAVETALAQLA